MRLILILFLSLHFLYGSLSTYNDYEVDSYISDSLDIPRSFLRSKRFAKIYLRYKRLKNAPLIGVKRIESYFIPELEKILDARGVPEVFLFMAMAESNFTPKARSHKAAVGIWQFLPFTARKYGLRVDRYVDERKDPIKATNAAVKYLRFLHDMFGKWYLAALAYNAGEGTVLKAIEKAGTDDVNVLLDPKKRYLPKESRLYLYKIIALARLSYDFDSKMSQELGYILARGEDYHIMPVKVAGGESLDRVARLLKMKKRYLQALNPHLIRGYTPPGQKSYHIYIPHFKYAQFKKAYRPAPPRKRWRGSPHLLTYKVRPGDTLYSISKSFGVSLATLKRVNGISGTYLRAGQLLKIPMRKRVYRVRQGDTILKIARRFGVDPKKLKKWNRKATNFIRVGEKLVVLY
ncbi:MAG: LysM peptidoglycan-binding domain-containing protein [Epsilonproteobacteria bacterium]|nr:lytic transglycosylase [Campylobacterota bacterium]NPA57270.1 LysM peptidoglycan-binding domain-containing protein [Campylobacterota bacterium]